MTPIGHDTIQSTRNTIQVQPRLTRWHSVLSMDEDNSDRPALFGTDHGNTNPITPLLTTAKTPLR